MEAEEDMKFRHIQRGCAVLEKENQGDVHLKQNHDILTGVYFCPCFFTAHRQIHH